jgi:hypothetical protein
MIRPPCTCAQFVKMTLHPLVRNISFNGLKTQYGTPNFQDALANFVMQAKNPGASRSTLLLHARNLLIPFQGVPTFHVIKFTRTEGSQIIDSVHTQPK